MSNRSKKVIKYSRPFSFGMSTFVSILLIIYLAIITINYLNKEHISIYEVTEKQIADDNSMTGIIIRNEIIVHSTKAGYINYYVNEEKKIAKNSTVYTIDGTGKINEYMETIEKTQTRTQDDVKKIRSDIYQYKKSMDLSNYNSLYNFKYDFSNTVAEMTNETLLSDLQSVLQSNGEANNFDIINSESSGILSYSLDGMEGLTSEAVTMDMFDKPAIKRTQLRDNTTVEVGSPVYKLIPDENWSVVVPLSDSQWEKLKEKTSVNFRFIKDQMDASAAITMFEQNGKHLAKLDLRRYMINYINDRYVEIELILNQANGLKIPMSAILNKDCYQIPIAYFTEGGDSNELGIIKEVYDETGAVEYAFDPITKLSQDEVFVYTDKKDFTAGEWIRNAATQERYQIGPTATIEGVYNVNNGYCQFKQVEKIYENPEYCIIKKDTQYGLSVYDHIVINPNKINEDDIIY